MDRERPWGGGGWWLDSGLIGLMIIRKALSLYMFLRRDGVGCEFSQGGYFSCRRMGVRVVWESQIVKDRRGVYI